ncbi:hypothetical protein MPSEU_000486900 [Mayamaea pseudoterrestris]|nr:hypothetical protein MPSEU_000486900 [Mayamaea pseudoterrestris]
MIREATMLLTLLTVRPITVGGFACRLSASNRCTTTRLLASSSTSASPVENYISRLCKLQQLLSRRGAPGSIGCDFKNDMVPVTLPLSNQDTPELISSMDRATTIASDELYNLHPFLYPIAKSSKSGNYICAYRDPHADNSLDDNRHQPWPIVESAAGAPGMRLLALNSEHLMRRIVCECDAEATDADVVELYNDGLGAGSLGKEGLDDPYTPGAVEKLGYGVDKYVLLRVGPFPDLYENMSKQHASKGDERSSLIAAETASRKLPGFGSTFLSYAKLLRSFSQREEEARDAARMCLHLPLSTVGFFREDLREVAVIAQVADVSDPTDVALTKLKTFYDKIKEMEREDSQHGKTLDQSIIDEVNSLVDIAALEGKQWSSVRQLVSEKLRAACYEDLASFVDFSGL